MDTNGNVFDAARTAIADELRSLRARRRMTQTDLAKASSLSRVTIGRIENAERDLTFPQLMALTAALDTTPAEFTQAVQNQMNHNLV